MMTAASVKLGPETLFANTDIKANSENATKNNPTIRFILPTLRGGYLDKQKNLKEFPT
jgi:hypothetical protein